MSVNLAIRSWTEVQDGFESARIKGALLKRKQALRETCDRMRLLTLEEGKCKVTVKKKNPVQSQLCGAAGGGHGGGPGSSWTWIWDSQQREEPLRPAPWEGACTLSGGLHPLASALPECPYP